MKRLTSSLITGLMLIASPVVLAQSYEGGEMDEMVGSMDDNDDNAVDFKEFFKGTVTDNKDTYDINHDGYITAGEVAQELKHEIVETVSEMNRLGVSDHDEDVTVTKALNAVEKKSEEIVKQMDTDHDNLVEEDELQAFKHKQFDALDKNKDGVLSDADLKKESKHKGFPIRLR